MKNLVILLLCIFLTTLSFGQNECTNKPIPTDGYELTGLKRVNQPKGCVVYWLEYQISSAKLCIVNNTDKTIRVTKAQINWRKSKPKWTDIYIKPGERKERTLSQEVWIKDRKRYVTPKPTAQVIWNYYQ